MASGISKTNLENTRRKLIDYIEELNSIFNKLELEITDIQNNLSGGGVVLLNKKFTDIQIQSPIIKKNIMTYINDIENILIAYENQDEELSQQITKNIENLLKKYRKSIKERK